MKTLKPQQKGNALTKGSVERHNGVDLEIDVVPSEDEGGNITWAVENLKFSAKQPVNTSYLLLLQINRNPNLMISIVQIEVIIRKEELQNVAQICKLEMDSMGRIAAGILRLLKLDGSVGQAALDQLSHLGNFAFFM